MITIDGSYGEGGGQMLRTALALSSVLDRPFRMTSVRVRRKKPGLMPQHLMALKSAAVLTEAAVTGDRTGSTEVTFVPGRPGGGNFSFDIGTAGAVSLLMQTVLPILLFSGGKAAVTLTGGTHVPFSPPFNYLQEVFVPMLGRIGCSVRVRMDACGFYPRGGGKVSGETDPVTELKPLRLEERGEIRAITGISAVANLPETIAGRQHRAAAHRLQEAGYRCRLEETTVKARSPGTFIFLRAEAELGVAGFSALGAPGKPAETVGAEAAALLVEHAATGAALDPHLADQLVPYLALCPKRSVFTTSAVTEHLLTNLWVVRHFHDFAFSVEGEVGKPGRVVIN